MKNANHVSNPNPNPKLVSFSRLLALASFLRLNSFIASVGKHPRGKSSGGSPEGMTESRLLDTSRSAVTLMQTALPPFVFMASLLSTPPTVKISAKCETF